MHTITRPRDERINLRLKHDAKETLKHAAQVKGQTVSKFILNSALACAEETIRQHEVMTLNRKDSKRFFDALSKPIKFNDKLASALKDHDRRVLSK